MAISQFWLCLVIYKGGLRPKPKEKFESCYQIKVGQFVNAVLFNTGGSLWSLQWTQTEYQWQDSTPAAVDTHGK